ncbi:unnamed protein product [Rhizophagus irregularis]|uniref:Golgi apparatus membrane protein TVP18 n=1 Tax=Rhizophagus irregularis TaxID=588596 RepID=A0A2I1GWD0_9GLOM|nr:hypothetical protein RhiirA4_467713 [Rhizophagus irregularis]CAB4426846.1 unnamed protein product [Rhizophagus irregularis]
MGFIEEFKSRNFSIYAQWAGILSIPFLFLAGGLAFLTFVVFSIIAWILAFILIFIEVPFCLKICPTSQNFDAFIRIFENNLIRTIGYLAFSVIMFIFVTKSVFYVMPGLSLAIAGICYGIAALKHQNHVSSKLTGGTGV